jgi:hypothetical protein
LLVIPAKAGIQPLIFNGAESGIGLRPDDGVYSPSK